MTLIVLGFVGDGVHDRLGGRLRRPRRDGDHRQAGLPRRRPGVHRQRPRRARHPPRLRRHRLRRASPRSAPSCPLVAGFVLLRPHVHRPLHVDRRIVRHLVRAGVPLMTLTVAQRRLRHHRHPDPRRHHQRHRGRLVHGGLPLGRHPDLHHDRRRDVVLPSLLGPRLADHARLRPLREPGRPHRDARLRPVLDRARDGRRRPRPVRLRARLLRLDGAHPDPRRPHPAGGDGHGAGHCADRRPPPTSLPVRVAGGGRPQPDRLRRADPLGPGPLRQRGHRRGPRHGGHRAVHPPRRAAPADARGARLGHDSEPRPDPRSPARRWSRC